MKRVIVAKYRDYGRSMQYVENIAVKMPPPVRATALFEVDMADPLNQDRIVSVKIGDGLAYKMSFAEAELRNLLESAILAALMLGVEHGDEIREAIGRAEKLKC